jgi:hypothetical protein
MVSIITYCGSKRDRRQLKEQKENIQINEPFLSFSISFFFQFEQNITISFPFTCW